MYLSQAVVVLWLFSTEMTLQSIFSEELATAAVERERVMMMMMLLMMMMMFLMKMTMK